MDGYDAVRRNVSVHGYNQSHEPVNESTRNCLLDVDPVDRLKFAQFARKN